MTPSELTMLARLGGDAAGMSTVAEVIAARHCGLEVLGISCITDMAIGEELEPLSHEQVVAVAERTKPKFQALGEGVFLLLKFAIKDYCAVPYLFDRQFPLKSDIRNLKEIWWQIHFQRQVECSHVLDINIGYRACSIFCVI